MRFAKYFFIVYTYIVFVYEDVIAKEFTPYESYSGLLLLIIMAKLLLMEDD